MFYYQNNVKDGVNQMFDNSNTTPTVKKKNKISSLSLGDFYCELKKCNVGKAASLTTLGILRKNYSSPQAIPANRAETPPLDKALEVMSDSEKEETVYLSPHP